MGTESDALPSLTVLLMVGSNALHADLMQLEALSAGTFAAACRKGCVLLIDCCLDNLGTHLSAAT